LFYVLYFFFQAEDGIRDRNVTGVQTCALPISLADIAAAYGCQSAVRGNTAENTERTIILVGTVNALEALRLLLPSISNQMEASAKFMSSSHISDIRELRNTLARSWRPSGNATTGRSCVPTDRQSPNASVSSGPGCSRCRNSRAPRTPRVPPRGRKPRPGALI